MAKRQQGFQLPIPICDWIAEEQAKTGATKSRIATSALVLLKEAPAEVRTAAMRKAMLLETRNAT